MNLNGPVEMTQDDRFALCHQIANRLHEVYKDEILAIGVYGSISRGTDGPYSDIEMFCVLTETGEAIEHCYEWVAGPWKAEVDVYSANVLLQKASTVGGRWPLTHGPFFSVLSLYDPEHFFQTLKAAAESPEPEEFSRNIREVLVGEMYEYVGKLRNVSVHGPATYLPYLAVHFTQYGAMLIGLHNRKLYSTGAMVLPEALECPNRPAGFDRLAQMVMCGELTDPKKIVIVCEAFWQGLVNWANDHEYAFVTERIPL